MNKWELPTPMEYRAWKLPMVEIFETVEGEGTAAGYPTVFVRVFHCNLRCAWCDTPYSYAPARPEFEATIGEILDQVKRYPSRRICLTGGEPLMHRGKSAALLAALADLDQVEDVHVETNGAIDLAPFDRLRRERAERREKIRFIMDYKLPASGEAHRMVRENFRVLTDRDEVKFVIGDREDFRSAVRVVKDWHREGQILFSPVFETLPPRRLVEWVLAEPLPQVKVNLQLHKWIWDPAERGV
ncbi:7-carboxy-7-deazaguanine synthase [Melghirimyces profundicolus]|uniref:7-carboxy-7-deazaguanine synthase n=1 Tax=Melghirimyces profundicolus TaxID=1242148 RepID=A0A2T6BW36_9BACL|nr:radical SAM protein [Melghirimyces profundicolus]PTX60285.1 7-carboxy-7-deazaguanine synthase [Melghirimyces profundicolus]